MAIASYNTYIALSGDPVDLTDERSILLNVAGTEFTCAEGSKRLWSPPMTVKVGGSVVSTGFTVDYLNGVVTFDSKPGGTVTFTGKYLPTYQVNEVRNYRVTMSGVELDNTGMAAGNDRGFYTSQPGLIEIEGEISGFFNFELPATRGKYVILLENACFTLKIFIGANSLKYSGNVRDLENTVLEFYLTEGHPEYISLTHK